MESHRPRGCDPGTDLRSLTSGEEGPRRLEEEHHHPDLQKGDEALPSNWRPISLQNAVYKVYAAIWGRRLACWAGETGAIAPALKGFVPGEGCLEHSLGTIHDGRRETPPLLAAPRVV